MEMERLIDKMLSTEFERYATADLNRPLDEDQQILDGVCSFFEHITAFVFCNYIQRLLESEHVEIEIGASLNYCGILWYIL
jgi:hypothetical protein